jgi:broad specificity phosphatase PhoE/hypoxanthine phosphoribosyltransferase
MNKLELIGYISAFLTIFTTIFLFVRWYAKQIKSKITWKQMEKSAHKITEELISDRYYPTLIFGIGRGGAIFGSMLSGCLGQIPVLVIDRQYFFGDKNSRVVRILFKSRIPARYLKNVLLVAGDANTGASMDFFTDFLNMLGAKSIRKAVYLKAITCLTQLDYFSRKTGNIIDDGKKLPWRSFCNYKNDAINPNIEDEKEKLKHHCITLYLVRHVETEAKTDVIIGRTDSELTVKGVQQAVELANPFIGSSISAIYTSPAGRAYKTATIINGTVMCNIIEDVDLMELDFGEWEGASRDEIKSTELYTLWNNDPINNIPENGESPLSALERIERFLKNITSTYKFGDEIIAVSHRTLIRILVSRIMFGRIDEYRTIDLKNGDIIKLIYNGTIWAIDEEDFKVNRNVINSEF